MVNRISCALLQNRHLLARNNIWKRYSNCELRKSVLNTSTVLTSTSTAGNELQSKYFSTSSGRFTGTAKGIGAVIPDDNPSLWVNSKPTDLKPPVGMTVPELIRENMGNWDHAVAFECAETGLKYTHGQVLEQSRGFAAALLKSDVGFKRGDVVAIMAHNIPEYCAILFGIWDAGLVPTTVNPAYTSFEIKHQLSLSGARAVVSMPQYLPLIRAAQTELPALVSTIIVGRAQESCHTFSEMVRTNPMGMSFCKGSEMDTLNETSVLLSSSGTTGPPKQVMLTHSNLVTNTLQYHHPQAGNAVERCRTSLGSGRNSELVQSKLLAILPFFHLYAFQSNVITTMFKGAHTMTMSKFKPDLFVDAVRRHKPTDLTLVPPLVSFMVQHATVTREDLKSVRSVTGGAAPVGRAIINQLLEKAGRFVLFQEAYGMTELSPVSHMLNSDTRNTKIGSCGTPVPLTMTKIVDVSSGKTLPRFEKGQVCVKGPQVMKGYFKNEDATRNTIDSDGWLRTGDIGYYDNEDCLYIVDRLKELIKVKGFQVAPSELEDLLRCHEAVADVAVIGVPDEESGELPRAYIVAKANKSIRQEDVTNFLQGKVAAYKQLRGGIEFVQNIPKTASGKILRKTLLANFKEKELNSL